MNIGRLQMLCHVYDCVKVSLIHTPSNKMLPYIVFSQMLAKPSPYPLLDKVQDVFEVEVIVVVFHAVTDVFVHQVKSL